jgi:disulfide oxidoreductase YuzD
MSDVAVNIASYRARSENLKAAVGEKFSLDAMAKKYIDIYERIMKQRVSKEAGQWVKRYPNV